MISASSATRRARRARVPTLTPRRTLRPTLPMDYDRTMRIVVASTAGLSLWIILWALGIKSFDAFLLTIAIILGAIIAQLLLPILPGNRDS